MNLLTKTRYSFTDFFARNKYPFEIPPLHTNDNIPQLLELTEEPYGLVNGHNISIWFYTDNNGNIVELIEAGHSNSFVCGKATSLFVDAILSLKFGKLELFTAGSLWIKTERLDNEDQKVLRQLRNDLLLLEQKTGLVKVTNEKLYNLSNFRRAINNLQNKNASTGTIETEFINSRKSSIGLLDYQQFKLNRTGSPVKFKIKHQLYQTQTYEKLLNLHAASLHNFRIQDIIRRANVYSEWLLADIIELVKLIQARKDHSVEEWNFNIIPYSGTRDYYTATTALGEKKMDIMFREVEENYQKWFHDFSIKKQTRKDSFEQLLRSVEIWSNNTRNKELLNYGLTSLRERYENTAPFFIFHDFDWIIQMVEILILDYEFEQDAIPKIWDIFRNIIIKIPDYRIREEFLNIYKPNLINSLGDLWKQLFYALQRFTNQNNELLPNALKSKIPLIFEKLNKKRDVLKRQKRVAFYKKINESVLIDALVRGWPSYFLRTTELKDLYKVWSDEVRESIWKEIHFQLRKKKTKILPFIEQNVTFQVSQDDEYLYLLPFFGINSERFFCFNHKKIGVPHFSLPWTYKTINKGSSKETNYLFEQFWGFVKNGDYERSHNTIKTLFKINPIHTCSEFFNKLWNHFGQIEDENISSIYEFQLALEEINNIETYEKGYERLKLFNSNFSKKIVDAPLRLAYLGGKYYERLKLLKEYNLAIEEQKDYFQELDHHINEHTSCRNVAGFIKLPTDFQALVENNPRIDTPENSLDEIMSKLFSKSDDLISLNHLALLNKPYGNSGINDKTKRELHLDGIRDKNSKEILEYVKINLPISDLKGRITQQELDILSLHEILKEPFQKALKSDQDDRNLKIDKLVNSLNAIDEHIWEDIQKSSYFQEAKEIDEEFVKEVLENKRMAFSYKYVNEYEPYFYLNVADSKMRIIVAINNWLRENEDVKHNEVKPIARSFSNVLEEINKETLGISEDDKKKVDQLKKSKIMPLVEHPYKEDSYTRLDLLAEAQNLISHFASQCAERYQVGYLNLPLYTPAYMKFMELKFLAEPEYVSIINELTKKQVPLGAVLENYKIITDFELKGAFIPTKIEVVNNEINVFNNNETNIVKIKFENEETETLNHIKQEVEKIAFRTTNLHSQGSSLASRILNAKIPSPPKLRLLQRILIENLEAFKYILAYWQARLSPNISGDAYGKKVDRDLLSLFRDIELVTKEQQEKLRNLSNDIKNTYPTDSIAIDKETIKNRINEKNGYRFENKISQITKKVQCPNCKKIISVNFSKKGKIAELATILTVSLALVVVSVILVFISLWWLLLSIPLGFFSLVAFISQIYYRLRNETFVFCSNCKRSFNVSLS